MLIVDALRQLSRTEIPPILYRLQINSEENMSSLFVTNCVLFSLQWECGFSEMYVIRLLLVTQITVFEGWQLDRKKLDPASSHRMTLQFFLFIDKGPGTWKQYGRDRPEERDPCVAVTNEEISSSKNLQSKRFSKYLMRILLSNFVYSRAWHDCLLAIKVFAIVVKDGLFYIGMPSSVHEI